MHYYYGQKRYCVKLRMSFHWLENVIFLLEDYEIAVYLHIFRSLYRQLPAKLFIEHFAFTYWDKMFMS